jgi:hypothetical protein
VIFFSCIFFSFPQNLHVVCMPFKTSSAAAAQQAPPSPEAIAIIENSLAEVYLLAKWQGAREMAGRYVKYSKAIAYVLTWLRDTAPQALGESTELNIAAAARDAAMQGLSLVPPSVLASLQTCSEIRGDAARAYEDRDTAEKRSDLGFAHARLQNLLRLTHSILSGTGEAGDGDEVVVSEDTLTSSSSSTFRALLFWLDIDATLQVVTDVWTRFKHASVGLLYATITTNKCLAFIRALAEEVAAAAPYLSSLETLVAEVYMQPAVQLAQERHALGRERAVEVVSGKMLIYY